MTPTGLTYDPGLAREHAKALQKCGIGYRRIACLAEVPHSTITRLLYGHTGQPMRYLHPEISKRILAISPAGGLAPSALIDGTAARRRLQALVALGWTQTVLAARLGVEPRNIGSLMARPKIRAATDRAVARLYDELTCARFRMPPAPDESTPRARADAAKARKLARRRGWPPPGAWDDETIGDPDAVPVDGSARPARRNWRSVDLVAAVDELARQGYSRRDAAERLGTTRDAVEAAYRRVRNKAA